MATEQLKLKMRGCDLKKEIGEGRDLVLGLTHTANVFAESDIYENWVKHLELVKPIQGNEVLEKAGMTEEEKTIHSKEYDDALLIMKQGVVKVDHFENIYRLEPKVDGVPNFRQAEGFWIFGCGQPTLAALSKLFMEFKSIHTHMYICMHITKEKKKACFFFERKKQEENFIMIVLYCIE
ncbi:hypothetical protein RFI_05412 [Reticulomyxa filosa]|uniref:Uncharacterized protein n=1 Tax=Reticulomyxa filosa TaxID=46433 RepID=X6P0E5_RETFI|nr:hypothetical protein RFI_05412 [Reticulomyxa filosa]|eukprot:ETO31706.1 hypothetical protein RFI_05412 [Reticulomyxa filosa]